jgi:Kip1 ubiquitination-promoting complex protein 1
MEARRALYALDSLALRRLTESLLFVLGHTTVGPDAVLFDQTLKAQLAPLEKVARAPILAPIAGIVLNLDEAEERATAASGGGVGGNGGGSGGDCSGGGDSRGGGGGSGVSPSPVRPSDSICTELASSSCDLSQLDFLCDFEWAAHFTAGDVSLTRLGRLRDFVSRVKTVRVGAALLGAASIWSRELQVPRTVIIRLLSPSHTHACESAIASMAHSPTRTMPT